MKKKQAELSPASQLYVAEWQVREYLAHNVVAAVVNGKVSRAEQKKLRDAYAARQAAMKLVEKGK